MNPLSSYQDNRMVFVGGPYGNF